MSFLVSISKFLYTCCPLVCTNKNVFHLAPLGSWTQFFRDAGIPSSVSKRLVVYNNIHYIKPFSFSSYASIFEDNRISKDMLLDLNKASILLYLRILRTINLLRVSLVFL